MLPTEGAKVDTFPPTFEIRVLELPVKELVMDELKFPLTRLPAASRPTTWHKGLVPIAKVDTFPETFDTRELALLVNELVIGIAFTLALTRLPAASRPTTWHIGVVPMVTVDAFPPTFDTRELALLVKELVIGTALTLALTRLPFVSRPTTWHIGVVPIAKLDTLPETLELMLLAPLVNEFVVGTLPATTKAPLLLKPNV
jgi:hypothetical protein